MVSIEFYLDYNGPGTKSDLTLGPFEMVDIIGDDVYGDDYILAKMSEDNNGVSWRLLDGLRHVSPNIFRFMRVRS